MSRMVKRLEGVCEVMNRFVDNQAAELEYDWDRIIMSYLLQGLVKHKQIIDDILKRRKNANGTESDQWERGLDALNVL